MKEQRKRERTPFNLQEVSLVVSLRQLSTSCYTSYSSLISLGGLVKLDLRSHQRPPGGEKNPRTKDEIEP
ncbi:hypothetical protein [Bartonella sp. CL25QHWL]|uniref:hypothetical protein n=1 Tax=Bartonella sp. CL25QHWL TaxID=3243518 RepID=UPI0035D06DE2